MVTTGKAKKPKRFFLKIAMGAVLACGLLAAGIFGFQAYQRQLTCSETSDTYEKAVAAMNANDKKGMEAIAQKIENEKSYKSSTGCLATLTLIDLSQGNSTAAEARYKELAAISKEDTQLPEALRQVNANTVGDVKSQVGQAVKIRNESYENTFLFW